MEGWATGNYTQVAEFVQVCPGVLELPPFKERTSEGCSARHVYVAAAKVADLFLFNLWVFPLGLARQSGSSDNWPISVTPPVSLSLFIPLRLSADSSVCLLTFLFVF